MSFLEDSPYLVGLGISKRNSRPSWATARSVFSFWVLDLEIFRGM